MTNTLPRAWAAHWAADPSRDVFPGVSCGALDDATRRVAGRFAAIGLQPGDRVIVSCASSIDLVVAYAGAIRFGLVCVPTNTAYREREIAHVVSDAGPSAAIVDDDERAAWIRSVADIPIVGPDVALPDGPDVDVDTPSPDDPMLICYTSGTTGVPKGAVLSHRNLLAGADAVRQAWRWTPDDRLVLALPLFHMHGLGVGVHGTLLAGASAVLLPGFDVDGVLDAAREHAATMFFGVPTMYARFAASPRCSELGGLRLCVSGSAPLPPDLFERIREAAGQPPLERYGMTETMMLCSNPYEGERRPGTVGFPLPGVEMRLADDGEVRVAGPNVFSGYWQRDSSDAFDADGLFRTGDIGELDDDGYLRLVGRRSELIISGGYNVYPREVEDVLREHPSVADAAVVGTPDDEWGEVVTAYVVSDDRDADVLLAFASERLAGYKRPRIVRFVDDLPRNALGKVLKHELR